MLYNITRNIINKKMNPIKINRMNISNVYKKTLQKTTNVYNQINVYVLFKKFVKKINSSVQIIL